VSILKILDPLYHLVAILLTGIHSGIVHVVHDQGWSWALSIVVLTMGMRLLLFPVFVKQIRSQRAMQAMQPKMKELKEKYGNDKEKLNQEMMAMWKEAGTNPLSGCLPLLLQIPLFIALFHTLREIKAKPGCDPNLLRCYNPVPGFSASELYSAAHAKIFDVPIPASFFSSTSYLHALNASQINTRILCIALTILMGASTFITQRQLMSQNTGNAQMAQQQKIMLYIFPVLFLFYGFKFPVGVLLYWLTTNAWSMVQQRVVIKRMEPAPAGPAITPAGPAVGAKPNRPTKAGPPPGDAAIEPVADEVPNLPAKPEPKSGKPTSNGASSTKGVVLPPGGAITPTSPAKTTNQRPAGRSKNRKKGRR
jgi:YidC/Oxa1 family membrane protein insertase